MFYPDWLSAWVYCLAAETLTLATKAKDRTAALGNTAGLKPARTRA